MTSTSQNRHLPLYEQYSKKYLEQSADSVKAFCKSQLDLLLISSQCCVLLWAVKKKQRLISKIRFTLETPTLPMEDQICNGQDSEPLAWTATEQHSTGYIPTTFSTSYDEKVSKHHWKRKNCHELPIFLYYSFYFLLAAWNRTLTIACNTVLHKSAGTRTSEACCRLCKQRSQEPHSGRNAELFPGLVKIWTHSLANTGQMARVTYYRTM